MSSNVTIATADDGVDFVELDDVVLEHDPILEQRVGAPIPIRALVYDPAVRVVRVHYRVPPSHEWQTLELRGSEEAFTGTMGCDAVADARALEYYVEGRDAKHVLGSSGTAAKPHQVKLAATAPRAHLPGVPPPPLCKEPQTLSEASQAPASTPSAKEGPSSFYPSLSVFQDVQLATGSDVCTRSSQLEDGYSCFRAQGSQYIGTPAAGSAGDGGGLQLATTRLIAGLDGVLGPVTLGIRVGYAFRGGPKPVGGSAFLPLHAEGRVAYWFTDRPYGDDVSLFLLAAGGLAQIDSSGQAEIRENLAVPPPTAQPDNPATQTLDVWKKSGDGFVALGGGVFFPFGSTGGLLLELRAAQLFPSPGTAFSAALGYAVGL